MTPKVLVIGIDGVRFDRMQTADTPYFDTIADQFFAATTVPTGNATISGPCWASIATGTTNDVHGVTSNDLHGHRLDNTPCFLSVASQAGYTSYAAAGWLPLLENDATDYHGGAIFHPTTQYIPPRPPHSKSGGDATSDALVATEAAKALTDIDTDIAFVYFGQVDAVGHQHGTDGAYLTAINHVDAHIGDLVNTITARPTYHDEQWHYLVVTDHGHRDGGGHGGNSELERTAWVAGGGTTYRDVTHTDHLGIHRLALAPFSL